MATHKRFIVLVTDQAQYGWYGIGTTQTEAEDRCRQSSNRKIKKTAWNERRVFEFVSNKPFAPSDRSATEDEADCWVGKDGAMNWVRCDRRQIAPVDEIPKNTMKTIDGRDVEISTEERLKHIWIIPLPQDQWPEPLFPNSSLIGVWTVKVNTYDGGGSHVYGQVVIYSLFDKEPMTFFEWEKPEKSRSKFRLSHNEMMAIANFMMYIQNGARPETAGVF